jgi:predicted DNA binding CopG/RHH family protein
MDRQNKLDEEEQKLLDMFEAGLLNASQTSEKDATIAKQIASEHNKKNARISIRISEFDLSRIKRIAIKEGLPYQTLITSILHKYADNALFTSKK